MILSSPGQLSYKPSRIVSLVPSQTELLYYLGLEDETIAITKFCVHPESWFRNKPRIGGTKNIDIEKIRALKPDLIIANKEENVKEQVERLADEFPVWISDVNDLPGAYTMIHDIGRLTRTENGSLSLISAIKMKFDLLIQALSTNNGIPVVYLIWKGPYITIGGDTFIHTMIEQAGLINTFGNRSRYPEINITDLQKSGCKVVLLSSEPFPFKQKHIHELQQHLPGIKIILVDGEMFSWYGSRLLYAPAYFKQMLDEINND